MVLVDLRDRPDGNIVRLTRGPEKWLVQCKRWQSWQVQVDDIGAFAGGASLPGTARSSRMTSMRSRCRMCHVSARWSRAPVPRWNGSA